MESEIKDTEYPGTGEYNKYSEEGIYKCAGCGEELYSSSSKFDSHCGWPAFSSAVNTSVRRQMDDDGHRDEILCANCDGHLGLFDSHSPFVSSIIFIF
jgi:peptide-methionine (R)-S-oxide reductase